MGGTALVRLLLAGVALAGLAGCAAPEYSPQAAKFAAGLADGLCGEGNWSSEVVRYTPSGADWWYSNYISCGKDPGRDVEEYVAVVQQLAGVSAQETDPGRAWRLVAADDDRRFDDLVLTVDASKAPSVAVRSFDPVD